ncbi:MAG: hypothetical protein ACRDQ2_01435 [Gaiellales bacterium]
MANGYRGSSNIDENEDAGFRDATRKAVEDYHAKNGPPKPGEPVELRVTEMYVKVQNPIHEFIVVLEDNP